MLRLRHLEIEGFGPFAGRQTLSFPDKPGIVVIYGENMRGKTTLLNAIRYAFFGKVLGRGRREREIHSLSNRENAVTGKFGFSVTLAFDFDGQSYELFRGHEPLVAAPQSDNDYRPEVLLRRGGSVLSGPEQDRLLSQIFPEDISRFFLFDGELLQEYEELIINESEVGVQISGAIERILGVPILKAGRRHLSELADEADRQAATEALRHEETKGLGNALNAAISLRDAQRAELGRVRDDLSVLTQQKSEIEAKLSTDRRSMDLMTRRQDALNRAQDAGTRQAERRGEIKHVMRDAWRTLLREPIRQAREQARADLEAEIAELRAGLRVDAIAQRHCAICEQDIPPEWCEHLSVRSAAIPIKGKRGSQLARGRAVGEFGDTDVSGEVRQLVRQIQDLVVEEQHQRDEARDLQASLVNADQATLRSTQARHVEIVEQLAIAKAGIERQSTELDKQDARVNQLRRKLNSSSDADLTAIEAQAKLLRDSAAIFGAAVDSYKTGLRQRVEQSAT